MNKLLKQAFTLIELLVVIAIIGILSGLIIVGMNGVTDKANIAKSQVFSNSLRNSLLMNIAGEWKLDEGSGTAANDTWTKTNNGVIVGFGNTTAGWGDANNSGWVSSSNCISGTCLKFDGVDDYVDCGSATNAISGTSPFSLSYWVYLYSGYDYYPVFNKGISSAGFTIHGYGGRIQGGDGAGHSYDTEIFNSVDFRGRWALVCITYDGSNFKGYLDGVVKNTLSWTYGFGNSTSYSLYFGKFWGPKGLIKLDDVRIYNAAMPTSQIKEQYYVGLNKLLTNGGITKEDYQNKIGELATKL